MKDLIVLVDRLEDWKPFHPTDQVVEARDYLFNDQYAPPKRHYVINLCHNLKYLSLGYYCSLIAETRSHKIVPSVKTVNDLGRKAIYGLSLEDLEEHIDEDKIEPIAKGANELTIHIFFGRTKERAFSKLASKIFGHYPCPLLEVELVKKEDWRIGSIKTLGIRDLDNDDQTFFAEALDRFSAKIWRTPKNRKYYKYDLAILVNPEEKLPPSNPEALDKFIAACAKKNVYTEIIKKSDYARLAEFDALFIRETTAINNHTYKFAKKAEDEGMVVVDDTQSILRCTNKIFLGNLLRRHGISAPQTHYVSDVKEETLDLLESNLGYPVVLKIPDGSFSLGVKLAKEREGLERILREMLSKTSLVLAQQFLYTNFDWRIGILDGKALYACKYFMSSGHWQIYNHERSDDDFSGDFETLSIKDVPENVLKAALKSAKLIGKGLYGVDLKERDGEVFIVEVNDNPNIDHGVEDLFLGDALYDHLVDYFVEKIELLRHIGTGRGKN